MPEAIPLDIAYEDDQLLVVNKVCAVLRYTALRGTTWGGSGSVDTAQQCAA